MYDAEGNVLSGGGVSYTFDAFNQRVRIDGNGWNYEFDYDSSGRRVSVWQGNTRVQGQYYAGGVGVGYYANGMTRFQHKDWLGTERIRTRPDGSVEGRFYQGAFGDNLQTQGADTDGAHFAGLDAEANGTAHAQFRQLDTAHGKWMSPDPYSGSYDLSNPQSLNRYAYALNNPLTMSDPSGLDSLECKTYNYGVDGVSQGTYQECFTTYSNFGTSVPWYIAEYGPPLVCGTQGFVSYCEANNWGGGGRPGTPPSTATSKTTEPVAPNNVCSEDGPHIVRDASVDALSRLNPGQDESNNITPRDGNFANVANPALINTNTWTNAASAHGSSLQSPIIPGQNTFVVKLYADPTRGNIIAVVYPNGTAAHMKGLLPFLAGSTSVNVPAARNYLGCTGGPQ